MDTFASKARGIRLVVTDIDGVWTDSTMYYSADGEQLKAFSTYDGMAVAMLKKAGIEVAIITGENSEVVRARAKKLNIEHLCLGEQNKGFKLKEICGRIGVDLTQTAYIGDDINDLEALKIAGLSAIVPNSPLIGDFKADYITSRSGGEGAFRDFVDAILRAK